MSEIHMISAKLGHYVTMVDFLGMLAIYRRQKK
jgi:hypothetical protein